MSRARVEVGAEPRQVALREEDLGVVGAAAESHAVEGGGGGVEVAGHDRGTRQAGAQDRPPVGRCAVERFAAGADRGRVAESDEQVGAELQQPGTLAAGGGRPHALDQVQGVAVRPDRRGSFGRAQDVRNSRDGFAGFEQVMADLRWGGADATQAGGCVGVDAPAAVGWNVIEQRLADQAVTEPVAGGGAFDEIGSEGRIEVVEGVGFVLEPTHGGEPVGVEGGADDGDALQDLASGGWDAADHVDLDEAHPVGLVGGAAGQLGDGEWDACGERVDLLDEGLVGIGNVAGDERGGGGPVERRELEVDGVVAGHQAVPGFREAPARVAAGDGRRR